VHDEGACSSSESFPRRLCGQPALLWLLDEPLVHLPRS